MSAATCFLMPFWRGNKLVVAREGRPEGEDSSGQCSAAVPPGSSLSLAAAWSCLLEGATRSHLGPLSGLSTLTSVISALQELSQRRWPLKALLFHTSAQGHPDWIKDSAPSHLWTQGLKKWHSDRQRLCSSPVLNPDAYPCLYFLVLLSRASSPDPPVIGPTWCYLWCWLRRGAAKLRPGIPKASCVPAAFPLQLSVGFHAR